MHIERCTANPLRESRLFKREVTMHRTTDEKWKEIRFFLLEENRKRLRFIFHDAAAYYGGFFVKLYL
ncbi:hypothetical protein C1T30_16470 [Bacillus sp. MBGLi97]|nr:hypothetical protein C1T30_16470 [Bacillus sp. MBGLi97]